jgi:hypothetical protein
MPNNGPEKGPEMHDLIAVEKIAQWERLKSMVLDSVSSPITKRVYNMALNEFMAWFQQAPRPGFTKATVSAWRVACRVLLGLIADALPRQGSLQDARLPMPRPAAALTNSRS